MVILRGDDVEQNIDLSILVKDTPVTKITVSGIDIYIKIFLVLAVVR